VEEVETGERALEVMVIWGDGDVLRVEHLRPGRPYCVGESDADFAIGAELLGTPRLPLVSASGAVAIPDGADGELLLGDARVSVRALIESGHARADGALGYSYALPPFATLRIEYRGFTFVVRSLRASKVAGLRKLELDYRQQVWTGLSFALHALFLSAMYLLPPGASALSLETLSEDTRLATYLLQPPEVVEQTPTWLAPDQGGGGGEPADGEELKDPRPAKPRAAQPRMVHDINQEAAKNAGILGVLSKANGAWNNPFPALTQGSGELPNMLAPGFDLPFAIGMRNAGRPGGSGAGGTIDVGNIGSGLRAGPGFGVGTGPGFGTRRERVPSLRVGAAEVRGSLSKEIIRRVIQRRVNEVRFCYEQELHARPDLHGRVNVKFIISPEGAVQAATIESTELAAARVEACIVQAVRRFTFPAPDGGGIAVVSYPFVFDTH
jgi:hypothetical protein